jgi:Sec region non-globular protein
MKTIIPILSLFLFSFGQLWAQDNLDFLDKVNEKPKTTTPVKVKEEPVSTNKKVTVVTGTTKKKKSKKKKNNSLVTDQNPTTTTNHLNPTTQTNNPVPTEVKSLPVAQETVKKEEELVLNGLWVDPEVIVEPDGLPGFGSDISFGKSPGSLDSKGGTQLSSTNKPLFSFSEFFDKYKKAMMILGIIILFAFYRLRMAKPSSSGSRPYRR